jgi:hypothetical protein
MATTTPNYGWSVPTSSDLVKNGATAIETLGDSVDASLWNVGYGQAGKNRIINGGMDIWQRGTSFTVASSTQTYTVDRWMAYRTATGATVSRQTTSPNYSPYYTRVQRDSGNTGTNIIYLTQAIETLNSRPLAGKTITLSWWARAGANYSAGSSNLTWELASGTGTDQNMISGFTGQTNVTAGTKTLTTSWQQFTTTGTVGTSATQLGVIFYFTPVGTAGAADYFDIADVQIEVGSQATPFSRAAATIQGELAACQRYYYRATAGDVYTCFANGHATGTTLAAMTFYPKVTMRTTPSSLDYSTILVGDGVSSQAATSLGLSAQTISANSLLINATVASGLTQFRPYYIIANNSSSAYIGLSAEL